MHQAMPREVVDKAKELKANAEGKESPKKERRKGGHNIPIVAREFYSSSSSHFPVLARLLLMHLLGTVTGIETPGQISKSIVKRCDPCNRRHTKCGESLLLYFPSSAMTHPDDLRPIPRYLDDIVTPEGSKRCTCCAKKGTQCTYGKPVEPKERSKGRKFTSMRR